MSNYDKAMKHSPHSQLYMGFTGLAPNERRGYPWLGSPWFNKGRERERAEFVYNWELDTLHMLKVDDKLVIVESENRPDIRNDEDGSIESFENWYLRQGNQQED